MKTKEIIKTEYSRSQLIAKKLLSSPSYKDDFDKYNKATTILTRGLREAFIKDQYSIAAPYNIETLNRTLRGESVLAPEVFKVVNVVKREKDYIYVKIKIDEPKDRIFYILNKTLEMEQEKSPRSKKTRFRDEKLKALEVYRMRHVENLNFSKIARKLNPNITKSSVTDSEYRKTYAVVERAYNAAHRMIKAKE